MTPDYEITITINTENAAFEDSPGREVARILSEQAHRFYSLADMAHLEDGATLFDINGNLCGSVTITRNGSTPDPD